MRLITPLFALLVGTSVIAQAVPTAITYQGRLTDGNGTPLVDGTGYEIDIRLWTTAVGGTQPIWAARYSNVPVRNGAFNLILGGLGGGTLNGAIADLKTVFNTAPVTFIGLTVNRNASGAVIPNTTEILPRQQLLSSPYALRAEQAAAVDPNAITTASIKDGEVKTADLGDGAVTIGKLAPNSVSLANVIANSLNSSAIAGNSIDADRLKLDYAKFVDEKATNTNGGTFPNPARVWIKRPLNKTEASSGTSIALTGDSITLQPGVYWVNAQVPVYHSDIIAYLRKPDGTQLMRGTYAYGTYHALEFSTIQGPLVITDPDTVVEIWHFCPFNAQGNDRTFGVPANVDGTPERYTEISLLKIR